MTTEPQDDLIANTINNLTEKLSVHLLKEFLKIPSELQINLVLIKSSQLLLANILCHAANDYAELEKLLEEQPDDLKNLTLSCAATGFADKFEIHKH